MKHVARMIGILAIGFGVFAFMMYVEIELVLNERIIPNAGTTEAWLEIFRNWATVGIIGSVIAALAWYSLGQWWFKVNDWRSSGHRTIWALLILVPAALAGSSSVLTNRPQEGELLVYVFYFLNSLTTYYLGTALFSPSPFMYTPLGASALRRWKLAF